MNAQEKQLRSPLGLIGTLFTEQEKEEARANKKLLFISLMTNPVCNLACPDCYVGDKRLTGKELSLHERISVLDQAKELGAKTLRIAGEGEPLQDLYFWETIKYATDTLEMNAFFFTNGTLIDKNTAQRIYDNDKLTAVLKFSGTPEVMEYLTGRKGKFTRDNFIMSNGMLIPKYVQNMIDTGMNILDSKGNSRLGIEFLLRKSNFEFALDIFRWGRRNNVLPYIEQNLEAGHALTWNGYGNERVSDEDAYNLSKKLRDIDENEFGFTWEPSIPYLVGGICESEQQGCKKYTYNLVISSTGEINPCYAAYFSLGNIRDSTLKQGLEHPIRQELLENPKYNCLCRTFCRSQAAQKQSIQTPEDLNQDFDYHY